MLCGCGKAKPHRAGTEQQGGGHPKTQPRDSIAAVWLLLFDHSSAGFIFLCPFIKKRCKTLWTSLTSACWGHSSAALICFYFMYQAWLPQSRACHSDAFQDGVKTISSLEAGRVPREGVKPRECWSVSCLCYDFCHVTQSRPPASLSERGQLSQQGMGCCCSPHVSTMSLQNSGGGLADFRVNPAPKSVGDHCLHPQASENRAERRWAGWRGYSTVSCIVCLSRRDIQAYKLNSLLFIWVPTQPFRKIPQKMGMAFKTLGWGLFFCIDLQNV